MINIILTFTAILLVCMGLGYVYLRRIDIIRWNLNISAKYYDKWLAEERQKWLKEKIQSRNKEIENR